MKKIKQKLTTLLILGTFFSNISFSKNIKIVEDAAKNKVEVEKKIYKIGITLIPWASVVYAIDGSSEKIVTMNPSSMKAYKGNFLEKLDSDFGKIDTKIVGQNFVINLEELIKLEPQVMLIWDNQKDEAEKLKALGIAPIMVKNKTIEELQAGMKAVGEILGKEIRANEFIELYSKTYQKIKSYENEVKKAKKPKVLYLRDSKLSFAQGSDNFIRETLEMAGADNIAGKSISMEEIVATNPDIILLSNFDPFTPEDLYNNKIKGQDWSQIKAVKEKRVYKTPIGIYRWDAPGVETPLMMEWLAKVIQPEIFKDIKFNSDLKKYFKNYFNYELTDSDVAQILNHEANKNSKKINLE